MKKYVIIITKKSGIYNIPIIPLLVTSIIFAKGKQGVTSYQKSSTPALNAGAYEALCLASGVPTRVTARLAYPSSSLGRLKEAESPGRGSPQNERDASLIPLHFGGQQRREYPHPKGAYRTCLYLW